MKNGHGDKTIEQITTEYLTVTQKSLMARLGVIPDSYFVMPASNDFRFDSCVEHNHKNSHISQRAQKEIRANACYNAIVSAGGFDRCKTHMIIATKWANFNDEVHINDGQGTSVMANACSGGTELLPTLFYKNFGDTREECEKNDAMIFAPINTNTKSPNFNEKYPVLLTLGRNGRPEGLIALQVESFLQSTRLGFSVTIDGCIFKVDGVGKIVTFFNDSKKSLKPFIIPAGFLMAESFYSFYKGIKDPPTLCQVNIEAAAIAMKFLSEYHKPVDSDIWKKTIMECLEKFKGTTSSKKKPSQNDQKQFLKLAPKAMAESRKDTYVIALHMLIRYNENLGNEISMTTILTYFKSFKSFSWLTIDDLKAF